MNRGFDNLDLADVLESETKNYYADEIDGFFLFSNLEYVFYPLGLLRKKKKSKVMYRKVPIQGHLWNHLYLEIKLRPQDKPDKILSFR